MHQQEGSFWSKNKEKQQQFVNKHSNLSEKDKENVIFSDEAPLYLFNQPSPEYDVVKGTRSLTNASQVKNSAYVMIWRIIQPMKLLTSTLHQQSQKMSANHYVNQMIPSLDTGLEGRVQMEILPITRWYRIALTSDSDKTASQFTPLS